jgi:hypothetical protein
MFTVPRRILKIVASFVWYVGGIVLLLKGYSLLVEADSMRPGRLVPILAFGGGLLIGGMKARFIFVKSCRKNMARIDALRDPKIWLFYRPMFFVFLAAMIATGATLSRLAHGNYPFLIGVATLDFSIATALLASSYVFWKQPKS